MAARTRLLIALLGCSLVACASLRGPLPFRKLGVDDERSVDQKADEALRAELPLIDDPVVLGFLNDLGQSIVRTIEPQPFVYRFRLVRDRSLNAFSLPGGSIYLHTGTLLAAGSLDELAGVMAHEIAHVKAHHYARGVEQSAIPNLLTQLAGIAAAAASGEVAPLVAAQGANIALQLRFTRAFEAEADRLGQTFMARAGYAPAGMVTFFRRLLAEQEEAGPGAPLPPYLYSHPDVASRIDASERRARTLHPTRAPPAGLRKAFEAAQVRLAYLLESRRTTLHGEQPQPDRSVSDPLLERARQLAEAGDAAGALATLEEAIRREPNDARSYFRLGELLEQSGRTREAIEAWRRALVLDPEVGLTYYRIGQAYKSLGDRVNANFYLEQALGRFEQNGAWQRRMRTLLHRITFPVILEAGLVHSLDARSEAAPTSDPGVEFRVTDPQVVWWGRVGNDYLPRREELTLRWVAPRGETVAETRAVKAADARATSTLRLGPEASQWLGIWRVETRLDGDLVDRRTFRLVP